MRGLRNVDLPARLPELARLLLHPHRDGVLGRGAVLGREFAGSLLLIAFLAFFVNVVMTLGIRGVLGIFAPARSDSAELVRAARAVAQ